jgi:hypothetical protein
VSIIESRKGNSRAVQSSFQHQLKRKGFEHNRASARPNKVVEDSLIESYSLRNRIDLLACTRFG